MNLLQLSLGLLVALGSVVGATWAVGMLPLHAVVAPVALLIIVGGSLGFTLMIYRPVHIWDAVRTGVVGAGDAASGRRGRDFWRFVGESAVMLGLASSIFALMHVMMMLDQPERTGLGIALAFTGVVYGCAGLAVAGVLKQRCAGLVEAELTGVGQSDAAATRTPVDRPETPEAPRFTMLRVGAGLFVAAISVLYGAVMEGLHIDALIAPTSFLISIFCALGLVMAAFVWRRGMSLPSLLILRPIWRVGGVSDNDRLFIATKFDWLAGVVLIVSVMGSILGLVHVMMLLNEPDKIGPGIAVAMTSLIYGIAGSLVARAFSLVYAGSLSADAVLTTRRAHAHAIGGGPGNQWLWVLSATSLLLFALFATLYALKGSCPREQDESRNSEFGGSFKSAYERMTQLLRGDLPVRPVNEFNGNGLWKADAGGGVVATVMLTDGKFGISLNRWMGAVEREKDGLIAIQGMTGMAHRDAKGDLHTGPLEHQTCENRPWSTAGLRLRLRGAELWVDHGGVGDPFEGAPSPLKLTMVDDRRTEIWGSDRPSSTPSLWLGCMRRVGRKEGTTYEWSSSVAPGGWGKADVHGIPDTLGKGGRTGFGN